MNFEDAGSLSKKDDNTLDITVLVVFLTSLAIGGYYIWKYKHQILLNTEMSQEIFTLCKNGDEDGIRRMIAAGRAVAHVRDTGLHNDTPLHKAAQNGHTAIVQLLLNAGADKDAKNKDNWAPLHRAACNGHTAIVQLLLNTGADKDAKGYDNWAPLHLAACNGHTAIVQFLLQAGADKDAKNNNKCTPLHYAAMGGHPAIVQLLLIAGADKDAKDNYGDTVLSLAQSCGYIQVIDYLEAVQRWERRRYFLLLVDTCYIVSASLEDPLLLRRRSDADRVEQLLHLLNDTDVLELTSSVGEGDEEKLVVRSSISEIFSNRAIVELIAKFLNSLK